jgi:uncharacterized protein DUF4242
METYVVQRRAAWRTAGELKDASARSTLAGEQMPDEVAWIRSYVVEECDGCLGTISVYQASSPEAIRAHAAEAGLPVDEIVLVSDTVIVRDDPVAAVT